MELKQLLDFVEKENERINNRYPGLDKDKMILARTVKLGEELGELCNEVLAHHGLQRQGKLEEHHEGKLLDEFADVILTTLLIAKSMNVDIEKALEKKMEKLNKRA